MIGGEHYYFFRLDRVPDDFYPEYRIAKSVEDLHLRFGDLYMSQFYSVTQLNEVTLEHFRAFHLFLLQQIS